MKGDGTLIVRNVQIIPFNLVVRLSSVSDWRGVIMTRSLRWMGYQGVNLHVKSVNVVSLSTEQQSTGQSVSTWSSQIILSLGHQYVI